MDQPPQVDAYEDVDALVQGFNPCSHGSATSGVFFDQVQRRFRCFNPCSHGSATSGPKGSRGGIERLRVSILVLMDQPPQALIQGPPGGEVFLFQSLFSWISHLRLVNIVGVDNSEEFQSLFSWISHL